MVVTHGGSLMMVLPQPLPLKLPSLAYGQTDDEPIFYSTKEKTEKNISITWAKSE